MTTHTPGPWQVGSDTHRLTNITEWWVYDSKGEAGTFGIKVPTEGDAHLIAAAPDLLAALQLVINGETNEGLTAAVAAVAKALGTD